MNANLPTTTITNWLQDAQNRLKEAGIDSYPLDSLVILEVVTEMNKAHLLAHSDKQLTIDQLTRLEDMLTRRVKHEPLAYITGVKEFYGREFIVNNHVLIPRPESESFIELLKKHTITHQNVIDVGSGSGILGITTKLELATNNVTLADIDKATLTVARHNAAKLKASCKTTLSDLLPASTSFDVVLANLPYVPNDMPVQPELSYEPALALYAEDKGLALYQRFWQQLSARSDCTRVLTESLQGQHDTMIRLAIEAGYRLIETDGLVQLYRQR